METKERNIKVFAKTFDEGVVKMSNEIFDLGIHTKIRLMPDTHVGKAAAIGFTAPLGQKVVPNIVGVDIGCGMMVFKLGKDLPKTLEEIDEIIKEEVPSGFDPRGKKDKHNELKNIELGVWFMDNVIRKLSEEFSQAKVDAKSAEHWFRQIGSLGSGNHFIEINVDDEGEHYLTIHSGSRGLGVVINKYWQTTAKILLEGTYQENLQRVFNGERKKLKNFDLAHLEGKEREMYLNDMRVAQRYAEQNRYIMASRIFRRIFEGEDLYDKGLWFDSVHNFIGEDNIARKGATSARKGELAIVPINMRDGSLIIQGKGNEDWNNSAPHGAGRLMSRRKANENINLEEFKESMRDVYSTTVGKETLDEAPMAYKDMEEIIEMIEPTADVVKIIKPIYNFKGV